MPGHEQHDPLLVAQLAVGDPLDPARAQEAGAWLASCPDCAALAADLRRVSALVAAEPVPLRRRDFRLTPEQAEAARGNAITRVLRGLSFPRARAFAPAAAGIMSVGLVFVVAGYAWPEDGSIEVASEANLAPALLASPPAPPLESRVASDDRERPAPAAGAAAETPGEAGLMEEVEVDDAVAAFAADPEFLDDLVEHQAGTSERSETQKALEPESVEGLSAADVARDSDLSSAEAPADAIALEEAVVASEPDGLAQRVADGTVSAGESTADTGSGEMSAAMDLDDDAGELERWLILLGTALAVGGGLLLLLGWLVRRTGDPPLRS